jgi:hypothetical protein
LLVAQAVGSSTSDSPEDSLAYRGYTPGSAFWKGNEKRPSYGEIHGIMQKMARPGTASRLPSSFGAGLMDMLAQIGVEPTKNNAELFSICEFKLARIKKLYLFIRYRTMYTLGMVT